MSDNYYIEDLIGSLKKDVVMERYYPLIDFKCELISIMKKTGVVRKDEVSETVIDEIRVKLGNNIANLFARFIHIYDFNKTKLKEIKEYEGTKDYESLSELLRLPGVRILRAELYYNSGINLKVLSEKTTDEIRNMVCEYINKEKRTEIVPQPKEVNCHREVAKMILHTVSPDLV